MFQYYTGRFIKNQQKYAKTNTVIYKISIDIKLHDITYFNTGLYFHLIPSL